MKIDTTLIAGAGAIGLQAAEALYKYNPHCVSILAKGGRLERYRKNGLHVNGEKIPFRFGDEKPVDLIIVASKFYHLNQIIADIKPYLDENTIILSLINGISSEDIIGAALGRQRLPLAIIINTDATHVDGGAVYTKKGMIHFGDAEGKNGGREDAIGDLFTRSGIPFTLEADMKRMYWYKYMINVGVNQVTAILRLYYGAFQNRAAGGGIEEACLLVEKAMGEVIAVANAQGIGLNNDDIKGWFRTINQLNPKGLTSMVQDVLAGRKTEVEIFGLAMMELGQKYGIPTPTNEMLYLMLRAIERSNGDSPQF